MLPIPAPRPQAPNGDAVAVLKKAKTRLWGGEPDQAWQKQKYICHAIVSVSRRPGEVTAPKLFALVEDLTAHVEACFYQPESGLSHCTYESWLVMHPDPPGYDTQSVQQARHRFIDQLIADFGGNHEDV